MRDLFRTLMSTETDMTLFYRSLARVPAASVSAPDDALVAPLAEAFYAPEQVKGDVLEGFAEWLRRYLQRAGPDDVSRAKLMNANPLYVPRNYLAQTVIQAVEQGELSMLAEWLTVLKQPYVEQPGMERWAKKRPEWARHQPGSSMLSCSS